MARFLVEIECDGRAFLGAVEPEIAYILARVVDKLVSWGTIPADGSEIPLRDSLGDRAGYAKLIPTR